LSPAVFRWQLFGCPHTCRMSSCGASAGRDGSVAAFSPTGGAGGVGHSASGSGGPIRICREGE
jgi:hypothetical protein